jgi:ABC-type branched-subunit amino acid transport system substrate-binding protein
VKAVLMIGTADHQIRYLKAAEQQAFGVPVVAPFAAYDLSIGPTVGKFIEDKYYVVLSHAPVENSPPEVAARFTTAMQRYFPKVAINTWTMSQWIAGEIFAEAVRRLGDKPPTRENLDRALRTLKAWQGSFNGPITYNDSGPNTFPNGCFALVKATADRGYLPVSGPRFVCSESY